MSFSLLDLIGGDDPLTELTAHVIAPMSDVLTDDDAHPVRGTVQVGPVCLHYIAYGRARSVHIRREVCGELAPELTCVGLAEDDQGGASWTVEHYQHHGGRVAELSQLSSSESITHAIYVALSAATRPAWDVEAACAMR